MSRPTRIPERKRSFREMPGDWPLAALEAQAVCARTYACLTTKHLSAYGFDVCSSTDCQAYSGIGEATSATDRAVEETADKPLSECSEAELLALWDAAKSHDPS